MTPYVIHCSSCPAKLKVSVPELVGQDVACPKCKTQLTLTPPEGWQPDAVDNKTAKNKVDAKSKGDARNKGEVKKKSDAASEASALTNRFDDLDDVLGGNTAELSGRAVPKKVSEKAAKKASEERLPKIPRPKVKRFRTEDGIESPKIPKTPEKRGRSKRASNESPQTKKKTAAGAGVASSATATAQTGKAGKTEAADLTQSPMLPDGSWDSPELKQRKKTIKTIAISAVAVSLIAIGATLLFSGSDANEKLDPAVVTSDPDASGRSADPAVDSTEVNAAGGTKDETELSVETSPPTESAAPADSIATMAMDESPAVKRTADFAAPSIPVPASNGDRSTSPPRDTVKTLPGVPAENALIEKTTDAADDQTAPSFAAAPELVTVPGAKDQSLAEFARALEESGTLLSDIQDTAFLQRESSLIGLPRYFVEVPESETVDVERQLNLKISGIKFNDAPVLDILLELESLSGIPVSFDWSVAATRDVDFDTRMTIDEKDATVESLFVLVATKLKMKVNAGERGVTFCAASNMEVKERQWELDLNLKKDSTEQLSRLILERIAPEALEKESAFAVSVTQNRVSVKHRNEVHQRVERLLADLAVAADPQAARLSAHDQALVPRALRGGEALAAKMQLKETNAFHRPYRLGNLLRKIRNANGLKIFVDWERLAQLGWTPATEIPGDFDEPTAKKALEQLARSLKVTWVVIDDDKVLLTTFQRASTQSDMEVYPVKHLLSDRFTSVELKRVLETTLSQQLAFPSVSVVYFPECDCLVAFAPQAVQRQVFSILKQLADDLLKK